MRKKKAAKEAVRGYGPEGFAAPEIVIPEVVNAEYRLSILTRQPRGGLCPIGWPSHKLLRRREAAKTLSSEDQARLKNIIDFAKSLPLVEAGYNTAWLIDLIENSTGNAASDALYAQILKGEIQSAMNRPGCVILPSWTCRPFLKDNRSFRTLTVSSIRSARPPMMQFGFYRRYTRIPPKK